MYFYLLSSLRLNFRLIVLILIVQVKFSHYRQTMQSSFKLSKIPQNSHKLLSSKFKDTVFTSDCFPIVDNIEHWSDHFCPLLFKVHSLTFLTVEMHRAQHRIMVLDLGVRMVLRSFQDISRLKWRHIFHVVWVENVHLGIHQKLWLNNENHWHMGNSNDVMCMTKSFFFQSVLLKLSLTELKNQQSSRAHKFYCTKSFGFVGPIR